MSLVNEALRKARAIAARQEALKRGIPYPNPDPGLREPRLRRLAWIGGAVLGIAAVSVFFYLVGMRAGATKVESEDASLSVPVDREVVATETSGANPSSTETKAAAAAEDTVTRTDTAPARPDDPQPRAELNRPRSSADAGGTAPGRRTDSAAVAAPPKVGERSATEGTTERALETPEIAVSTSAPTTEPAPATGPQSPRSFLREADLPGVGRLQLAGIAWSEDRPFALINGKVVGRGDSVDGLRVVEIQPKEVLLDLDGDQILLRLR